MFNSYDNRSFTTVQSPKTIVEQRAPTDDSIRLADEFREKVKDNLIKTFSFGAENTLRGSVSFINDVRGVSVVVGIHFVLNGEHYAESETVDPYDLKMNREEAFVLLRKKISDAVFRSLIKNIPFKQMDNLQQIIHD